MKIDELIEKYFEAETSPDEERILKEYFSSDDYDKKFEMYRQYFVFLNSERNIVSSDSLPAIILNGKTKSNIFTTNYKWLAVAASFVILFIIGYTYFKSTEENNAIIITNENFYEYKELGTEVTLEALSKISKYMGYAKSSLKEVQSINESLEILQSYNLINYQSQIKEN